MDHKNPQKLLPASHCLCCHQTIESFGGHRIVTQTCRGLAICDQLFPPEVRDNTTLGSTPLANGRYLYYWGEPSLWNDRSIANAQSTLNQNLYPWFCQKCAQRTCRHCGTPVKLPVGSDLLYNDGRIIHCAILPGGARCPNGCNT